MSGPSLERPRPAWLELWLAREREFLREPGVLFWVFAFPLLLAVALGLAFRSRGPEKAAVLVAAAPGAPSDAAARTAAALSASALLDVATAPLEQAEARYRRGEALVLVRAGDPPTSVHDATRPGAAAAAAAVRDALERAAGRRDLVPLREETVAARGRRYIDFLIPGLLGMSLMSGGLWGVGWPLVNMRIKRLLKRLAATPMSRPAFLGSFLLHRQVVALVETSFLLGFARLVFDLRVAGSWFDVLVVATLGALSFSGIGLLTGCRARNAETANGLMNLATLPMIVLSGVFFSASNFPGWARPMIDALPLTGLNDALRAVVNDGAGLLAVLPQVGLLVAWGVGSFLLALAMFRWQ